MPESKTSFRRAGRRRATFAAACLACLFSLGGAALAQDLESEIDATESELEEQKDTKQVLTSDIAEFDAQIGQLQEQVAVLRNREAVLAADLQETIAELEAARDRLEELKDRVERSLDVLAARLVDIYKSSEPDALSVILQADGFDDLIERYEYLQRIHDQDSDIVNRVRDLRAEQADLVTSIEETKASIEAKQAELERTRSALEAREAELAEARSAKQSALDGVNNQIVRLEGHIEDLEDQIQQQLREATETYSTSTTEPIPAGPIQGGDNATGMIWPVNGPVTSPFGWRWGRMHEGIDIGVPAGTPIRASLSGVTAIAAYTGGYGNYTCVNHSGGLSTCYAHQSSYATSVGDSVSQGEVIGYIGCTGSCFGDHLHFEVRVNGAATDPLGYL